MGKPYIIFEPISLLNEEVYYYPLYLDKSVVFVISVINTSRGWTLSLSDEMAEGLNRIKYSDESSYIFYECNDYIKAENEYYEEVVEVIGKNSENIQSKIDDQFDEKDYKDKCEIIRKKARIRRPVDNSRINNSLVINEGYSPAFSTSNSDSKICSLYNAQGQGSLPICWAASVATIVNYRKGTSYTAKDICDKMGTGYVGVNIDEKKDALSKYGLSFVKSNAQISWSKIKKNIDNKYPIAASTFDSSSNGHAITVYGYRTVNVSDYIVIWNSGTASSQTIYYNPNGSTYTYNNKTWTWTKTLSKYN